MIAAKHAESVVFSSARCRKRLSGKLPRRSRILESRLQSSYVTSCAPASGNARTRLHGARKDRGAQEKSPSSEMQAADRLKEFRHGRRVAVF